MTLAKGLGGGIPIGAVATTDAFGAGLAAQAGGAVPHASTFGGNPLACAAARAVFDIIEDEGLLERVSSAGDYLGQRLAAIVRKLPSVALDARGRGLLRGVRITGTASTVVARCRDRGVLLSVAGADVIRFAPPFVIERAQIDEAIDTLTAVLAEGGL
jgi:acetylornithine/succinyldiaminopimelate/putrescine aminotransferase